LKWLCRGGNPYADGENISSGVGATCDQGFATYSEVPPVVIAPTDTGTIRFFPELGILNAPVGDSIQSTYLKTTDQNRQFQRGFIEFTIPVFNEEIQQATLILTENRGTTTFPFPPDLHELSFYQSDLVVDTSDYNRPTTLLTSFETDVNEPVQIFSFDVTSLINQFQGDNLGLRIKLAVDPTLNAFTVIGSSFGTLNNINSPRLELTFSSEDQDRDGIFDNQDDCPDVSAIVDGIDRDANNDGCLDTTNELLQEIRDADIQMGIKNSLIVTVVSAFNSYDGGNNNTGNNQLQAFINEVSAHSGKAIPTELADLFIGKAENIIALHPTI